MSVEKSLIGGLLDTDIEQILNADTEEKFKYLHFNATLCSPAGELYVGMLKSIEWSRNYNDDIMEDLRVMFTLDGAEYRKVVHEYQDQLEMVINRTMKDLVLTSTRYKVFIVSNTADQNPDNYNYMTDAQLKALSPVEMEVQCVTRESYGLNDVMIEGIYKNATLDKVMMAEYADSLRKIEYQDGSPTLSVDMVEIDNPNTYGHINIPTGTKIMSLPQYLQQHDSYGVYNCGLGRFFQVYKKKPFVFVYPLFDPKQFDKKEDILMIFHSSHKRAGHYGNTYMLDGKILKIIPEYQAGLNDPKQDKLLKGESITYAKPDNVYQSYRDITNGETLKAPNKNNLITQTAKPMNDGSVRTRYIGPVSNAYKYRSETMANMMSIYQLTWYNSDIELIYPGMPCMFITEHSKNGIVKLRGQVQAVWQQYINYGDKQEINGQITIAVMSPNVLMDNEDYADTNVQSALKRKQNQ